MHLKQRQIRIRTLQSYHLTVFTNNLRSKMVNFWHCVVQLQSEFFPMTKIQKVCFEKEMVLKQAGCKHIQQEILTFGYPPNSVKAEHWIDRKSIMETIFKRKYERTTNAGFN
jgi:hypothetical protein